MPSRPMRPALVRRRRRLDHAVSTTVGTLIRRNGALYFQVSQHDVRRLDPRQSTKLKPGTRLCAVLWPRTGRGGKTVWTLARTSDAAPRPTTYLSGTLKQIRPTDDGQELVLYLQPLTPGVAPFHVVVLWKKDTPLTPGVRVLAHAHHHQGVLVAHHLYAA